MLRPVTYVALFLAVFAASCGDGTIGDDVLESKEDSTTVTVSDSTRTTTGSTTSVVTSAETSSTTTSTSSPISACTEVAQEVDSGRPAHSVTVFFYCITGGRSLLVPVTRMINPSEDLWTALLDALLAGPTEAEAAAGYGSAFEGGHTEGMFNGWTEADGALVLDFAGLAERVCASDPYYGGVCPHWLRLQFLTPLFETIFAYDVNAIVLADNGDCAAFWRPLAMRCTEVRYDNYQQILGEIAAEAEAVVDRQCQGAEACRVSLITAYRDLTDGTPGEVVTFFGLGSAAALTSVEVSEAGSVVVDFNEDILINGASTSTGELFFRAELFNAAFQHSWVETVNFSINGDCESFWGWQQAGECIVTDRDAWIAAKPDPESYVGLTYLGHVSGAAPGLIGLGEFQLTEQEPIWRVVLLTELVHDMMWMVRKVGPGTIAGPEWEVVNVAAPTAGPEGSGFWIKDECLVEGTTLPNTIAYGPPEGADGEVQELEAWRANLENQSFVTLDPAQVECSYEIA